jgi:hypothetical protein
VLLTLHKLPWDEELLAPAFPDYLPVQILVWHYVVILLSVGLTWLLFAIVAKGRNKNQVQNGTKAPTQQGKEWPVAPT